jgi:hypothetical protein
MPNKYYLVSTRISTKYEDHKKGNRSEREAKLHALFDSISTEHQTEIYSTADTLFKVDSDKWSSIKILNVLSKPLISGVDKLQVVMISPKTLKRL